MCSIFKKISTPYLYDSNPPLISISDSQLSTLLISCTYFHSTNNKLRICFENTYMINILKVIIANSCMHTLNFISTYTVSYRNSRSSFFSHYHKQLCRLMICHCPLTITSQILFRLTDKNNIFTVSISACINMMTMSR